jgi:hypothetical protein
MKWLRACKYKPFDPEAFDRDAVKKAVQQLR